MANQHPIPFNNTFARMPEHFFSLQAPTPVSKPAVLAVNGALAESLGIDPEWLGSTEGIATVAGNTVPAGAEPLASVYAGHQFGSYNPQLGDGRAILLGEVATASGHRYDIQLKGSGPTPYSRGGDGRSPLGPVVREYIISEAMHALGVPTTRALAAVTTGDQVVREKFEPGAILARVASSHIRIGTFQYFSAQKNSDALSALVDYTLARHFPDAVGTGNDAQALLLCVIQAQAKLIAHWQLLGFVHGVMNTDNMLLCGETVDYGPCAFMESFHPDTVFSSIDQGRRYAYRNQPGIAQWNLACLAQSLLPVLADTEDAAVAIAQDAVDQFPNLFMEAHNRGLSRKLGLLEATSEDTALIEDLFGLMADAKADFTLTFRYLADQAAPDSGSAKVGELYTPPQSLTPWLQRWQERLAVDNVSPADRQESMYRANPVFIPRNHLVAQAISAAENHNLAPFHALIARTAQPFVYDEADKLLATPAHAGEEVRQTFCGT
ncbi:MAG: protein adenylyltransferase SelO [Halioglobus sp.]